MLSPAKARRKRRAFFLPSAQRQGSHRILGTKLSARGVSTSNSSAYRLRTVLAKSVKPASKCVLNTRCTRMSGVLFLICFLLVKERVQFLNALGQVVLDDTPDNSVVYGVVAMSQPIPKRHNAPGVGQGFPRPVVCVAQAPKGFPDDFELTFHGPSQLPLVLVLSKRHPLGPFENGRCAVACIGKTCKRAVVMRRI